MTSRRFLMADGYPLLILRFDKKEEYSRQICSGKLRFTRISKYRDLPEDDQGRLDQDEGLTASLDGSKIQIQLGRAGDKEPLIIADAKRVTVHYNLTDTKILSLTVPGNESFKEVRPQTLRLAVNPEVQALGEWVTVIHHVRKFLDHIDKWGKAHGHQFRLQPIQYLTRDGHHLPGDNIGFRKFDDYAAQLEGRILVRGLSPEEEVTTIDVGNISDCAMVLHRDELPKIEVKVEPRVRQIGKKKSRKKARAK